MIVNSLFDVLDLEAERVAETLYKKIDEDISRGQRSGTIYVNPETGEPYQASAEDEHIQEVTSAAREGLDWQPTNEKGVYEVFIRDDLSKLIHLIYADESAGGRNLMLGSLDEEFQRRVAQ